MLQLFGILIIANILIIDLWLLWNQKSLSGMAVTFLIFFTAFALLAGLVLIFNQRAIELSYGKYGSLKVTAEQAEIDAKEVAEIRKRVEAQSATIDLVAEQATKAKELSEEVARKNVKAEEKLTEIDNTLSEANESLRSLDSYSKYYAVVIAAQGEDRIAYDELGKLAADDSCPFRAHAQQIHQKIMEDHSQGMYYSGFTVNWKEGVDPNKLTFEQLKQTFLSSDSYTKQALLEYIWKRNDIPKIHRLDFMVDVMKTDSHLTVCEYAGRYFTQGTELKIKPLALDYLIQWWSGNRSKFEEKPNPSAQNHQHN